MSLRSGEKRSVHTQHAAGSLGNPRSDEELEDKVRDLLPDWPEEKRQSLRVHVYALEE
jgi:ribosomal protein L13